MNEHGPFAKAGLAAGKHVLVEKPMATSLVRGRRARRGGQDRARQARLCPAHRAVEDLPGDAPTGGGGRGRASCCSVAPATAGPAPGGVEWFYQPGGGALFDLGVYNLTALCGFFGSVKRVTAMVGIAIPERMVEGGR